jgi:cell division cycle protein 20 (cofactor of APC complex)
MLSFSSPSNTHARSVICTAEEHQLQLSATYRTSSDASAAASAAAAGAAGGMVRGSSPGNQHLRSARHTAMAAGAASPARARAMAARCASIAPAPVRTLDSPGLLNDYYSNVLHVSSRGVLAIGLGSALYLWDFATASISALNDPDADENDDVVASDVTSLRWNADGTHLAVGYTDSLIKIWDVAAARPVQHVRHHVARVDCLDWNTPSAATATAGTAAGGWMLASGGKDASIFLTDLRASSSSSSSRTGGGQSVVSHFTTHAEEVCGLSFSPDGLSLASGANDNKLCLFNLRAGGSSTSVGSAGSGAAHLVLTHHRAAVKALAWCPWSDSKLLASGGGLADGHIRFCDAQTGVQSMAVDTKSQVCALQFARGGERELLSAHGAPENSLALWRCPDMTRLATLTGHSARVLHTSLSADGSTVVSASADETLRFWKIWQATNIAATGSAGASNAAVLATAAAAAGKAGAGIGLRSSPMRQHIR